MFLSSVHVFMYNKLFVLHDVRDIQKQMTSNM